MEYAQRVAGVTPSRVRVSAYFTLSTKGELPSGQDNDVETWARGKLSDILGLEYWTAVRSSKRHSCIMNETHWSTDNRVSHYRPCRDDGGLDAGLRRLMSKDGKAVRSALA